ncbi:hypothetical protein T459_31640 [Capsicum annuum]|uniref:Bulb-type lectin domain-containing protein n=1 Tax=Capsicum annuum TaxID=4072 RepID=A0A2G2Y3Z0_CAPAN|nr:hypothetical protein T459_31640 [Capsicum annuum]
MVPVQRVLWVANREDPLHQLQSGRLIGGDGNLKILDDNQNTVWSTNVVSVESNNTIVVLTDEGRLILKDTILSQEHLYGTVPVIPAEDDPSPGKFITGLSLDMPPQMWTNYSRPYWRA